MISQSTSGIQRNSSIEILRIIAMFFIVIHHYTVHGGVNTTALADAGYSLNAWLLDIMTLGNLGTNIFILIFGYFTVKSTFRVEKAIQLILQVWIYSVSIYCIFLFAGKADFSYLVVELFPTLHDQYWFFTAYFVFFLFTPYLNKVLLTAPRNDLIKLILLTLILWSIIPTYLGEKSALYGDTLPQFFMLYLIGAYFRLYPDCMLNTQKIGITLTAVCTSALLGYSALADFFHLTTLDPDTLYSRTSAFIIGSALGLFIIFTNCKPFSSKLINEISICTFGVYLIHDNPHIRKVLWTDILQTIKHSTANWLILHILFAGISVFTICIAIEWLRIHLLEKYYMSAIRKLIPKIMNSALSHRIQTALQQNENT